MSIFTQCRAHVQASAFIHSVIISSPLRRLAQSSRTAGTARRRAPFERVLELVPKAGIPNRVAAVRGSSDLTQQLGVEIGCKQSAKE
jgi:hypothetical protein